MVNGFISQFVTQVTIIPFGDVYKRQRRDYGDKESKVIENTVGNIFSGQVVSESPNRPLPCCFVPLLSGLSLIHI